MTTPFSDDSTDQLGAASIAMYKRARAQYETDCPAETPDQTEARVTRVAGLVARAADRQANLTADGEVTATEYNQAGFTVEHDGHLYRVTIDPADDTTGR
jgi:hypothetical protein